MKVIHNEQDNTNLVDCENCHKKGVLGRRYEVKHSAFGGGSRGWFMFCFECIGPEVTWVGERGEFVSPIFTDYDEKMKWIREATAEHSHEAKVKESEKE